jgi:hypothetical protein
LKKYIFLLILLCGCISNITSFQKEKVDIFKNRKDAIFSPSGSINVLEKAISPDGEFFAKEIEPYNLGKIGIFLKDGELFKEINVFDVNEENNDLKVISWHPDNFVIGVIYHKNGCSYIKFFEIFTGKLLRKIIVNSFYHYLIFDKNGEKIYLSEDGEKVDEINLRNTDFVLNSGINLPWLNYGWDIGRNPWGEKHGGFSSNKEVLLEKFRFFKKTGINVVRVFLFCDLRSAVIFDKNNKLSFDEYVYKDFKSLIDVAEETRIKILPVIFDFTIADGISEENGIKVGEHPEIFNDPAIQKKLLNIFEDFFKKIDTKNLVYAWDIINEPEHLQIENFNVDKFISEFIKLIRKCKPKEKVTVGAISRTYLNNYRKFNLDFYQFHYYDDFEYNAYLNYHVYNLLVEKPVLIGEIESTDIIDKLTLIWENGYKGAFIWNNEEFLKDGWKFYKAWVDVH